MRIAAWLITAVTVLQATSTQAATCSFPGEPTGPSQIRLIKQAEGFERPVFVAFSPLRADTFYVVEQHSGLLKVVVNGAVEAQAALDLSDVIADTSNETGFLGFAFHPRFAETRKVYVNYTAKSPLRTIVSELRMGTDGRIDRSTERILLTIAQPFSNHNGGHLAFGPDGYLYIGTGDGGSAGDPQGNGQNLKTLLAKMLRIDVDRGSPYAIPADNPAWPDPQAKREIWAYGLRNPWRFSFDRVTGELWAGDVGQDAFEEVDVVKKGGNYGWKVMEASACYRAQQCNRNGMTMPVHEYPRSEGVSITGGYVYRGTDLPALLGTYLYADFGSGKVWGARYDGTRVTENKLLLNSGINVSSFGEDTRGELYLLDHTQGIVYKIGLPALTAAADFPRNLAATGCFASLSPLRVADGIRSYDVQSDLWSDGATKERFIYVPGGQKLRLKADGTFEFPNDTVLIKHFYQQVRANGQSATKIIETRFLVKKAQGFQGYSYKWNDAATEATLLGGAAARELVLATASGDEAYSYYFPGSGDCQRCHAPGTGGALGVDAGHLNFGAENQLTRLAALGVIDASTLPGDLRTLPSYPGIDDPNASLDAKARSYLHTQCAECHNKAFGTAQGEFDLRYALSFAETKLCNTAPVAGDLGVANAKVLVPGNPEKSLLWLRVHSLAKGERMPPLASSRRDPRGDDLLKRWIQQITACP